MKIGMICRADNSGLGTLSREFARHLRPHKILIVENGRFQTFFDRYKDFDYKLVPSKSTLVPPLQRWMVEDIDVLLSIETFYNWDIARMAKEKGIKTALVSMYEMTPKRREVEPDLWICPSKLDYDVMPDPKVYIPIPLAMDRLKWRERKIARKFVHTASHGGMSGRKGTQLLLDAMKHVQSDIELIISSWHPIHSFDPRVEVRRVNYKDYWQCWQHGDVLVYPQDYNGICLPVVEAFASGLGVVTTDIYPFHEYLPKDLMFKPDGFYDTRAGSGLLDVVAAEISPKKIAEKIDEIANKDISKYSRMGKEWREKNSWDYLGPLYLKALENLCKQ